MKIAIFLLLTSLCLLPSLSQAQGEIKPAVAVTHAPITDLRGKPADPIKKDDRAATVLLFVVRDCPISNAYAPEINRITGDYSNKNIVFNLVYVDLDASLTDLSQHYKDFGYHCAAVYDREHTLVKQWKAQHTPEAVVISRDGKVLYQGRINDQYIDFGKSRHRPRQHDLRRVLDAIVEGRTISPTVTPVIGCPIPE